MHFKSILLYISNRLKIFFFLRHYQHSDYCILRSDIQGLTSKHKVLGTYEEDISKDSSSLVTHLVLERVSVVTDLLLIVPGSPPHLGLVPQTSNSSSITDFLSHFPPHLSPTTSILLVFSYSSEALFQCYPAIMK